MLVARPSLVVLSTIPPEPGFVRLLPKSNQGGIPMQWIDPAYCDIRLGFEVTAYVYVR